MAGNREVILQSLEVVADAVEDLSPVFYERLYARDPRIPRLFGPDSAIAQGRMLNEVINAVLDSTTKPDWLEGLIASEVAKHDAWDVSEDMYRIYFDCLLETLQALAGERWTLDMTAAWQQQFSAILKLVHQYVGT